MSLAFNCVCYFVRCTFCMCVCLCIFLFNVTYSKLKYNCLHKYTYDIYEYPKRNFQSTCYLAIYQRKGKFSFNIATHFSCLIPNVVQFLTTFSTCNLLICVLSLISLVCSHSLNYVNLIMWISAPVWIVR